MVVSTAVVDVDMLVSVSAAGCSPHAQRARLDPIRSTHEKDRSQSSESAYQ